MTAPCSPGSHPHSDRRNWRTAGTVEEYLRNCHEGLEEYSDRRAAKLLGVSRVEIWRWKRLASIPDDLFEALLTAPGKAPSTRDLANVAGVIGGTDSPSTEHCPHCGGLLRARGPVSRRFASIIDAWRRREGAARD